MQNEIITPRKRLKPGPKPKPLHSNPVLREFGCTNDVCSRFWRKVKKTDSCWLWTACKTPNGYGRIGTSHRKNMLAHRLSWAIHFGKIPTGLKVLHDCPNGDNRACVNPDHLWLGTIDDNQKDMAEKGRSCAGEKAHQAKLTWKIVRQIRKEYAAGQISQERLAERFGVGSRAISKIITGIRWIEKVHHAHTHM